MDQKLLNILNKSKKIIEHTNGNSQSQNSYSKPKYSQGNTGIDYSYYDDDYEEPTIQEQAPIIKGESAGKNLPKEIFESMISEPIASVEEVLHMHNPFEQAARKMAEEKAKKQKLNENVSHSTGDYILVSKSELKNMLFETLLEIVPKITSNIEESAIKKTIQTILKENKEKKGRI